ncbi:hypothetical protein P4O66_021570, partial [Electrophorus voltai]
MGLQPPLLHQVMAEPSGTEPIYPAGRVLLGSPHGQDCEFGVAKTRWSVRDVRVGNCASSTLTTGAPQGCVLSPLLYSLYKYNCVATSSSTIIVKFTDDTFVMGLILDNDERAYLEEIKQLENWCQGNNLLLTDVKELIVDCCKKQQRHYQPVTISGTTVERVDSFRYRGVHISQDLSWSRRTKSLASASLPPQTPSKSGLGTAQSRTEALQRVVRSAECITPTELPELQTIYYKQCQTKPRRIVKDPSHPNNRLFSLLRSGDRLRSLKTNTETEEELFPTGHSGPESGQLMNCGDHSVY